MAHFQERGLFYAVLLVWLLLTGTASATIMVVPSSVPAVTHISPETMFITAKDTLPSNAAIDYAWRGADAPALTSSARGLLDNPYASVDPEESGDLGDVTRHRGFGKALLIIIVCGALIRLLTSPAYLKYIADVLDPKAF